MVKESIDTIIDMVTEYKRRTAVARETVGRP